MIAQMEVK